MRIAVMCNARAAKRTHHRLGRAKGLARYERDAGLVEQCDTKRGRVGKRGAALRKRVTWKLSHKEDAIGKEGAMKAKADGQSYSDL